MLTLCIGVMRKSPAFKGTALYMSQVLGRCMASKADDAVIYFEAFGCMY